MKRSKVYFTTVLVHKGLAGISFVFSIVCISVIAGATCVRRTRSWGVSTILGSLFCHWCVSATHACVCCFRLHACVAYSWLAGCIGCSWLAGCVACALQDGLRATISNVIRGNGVVFMCCALRFSSTYVVARSWLQAARANSWSWGNCVRNGDLEVQRLGVIHNTGPASKLPRANISGLESCSALSETFDCDFFRACHANKSARVRPWLVYRTNRVDSIIRIFIDLPTVSRAEVLVEDECCSFADHKVQTILF